MRYGPRKLAAQRLDHCPRMRCVIGEGGSEDLHDATIWPSEQHRLSYRRMRTLSMLDSSA